MPDPNADCLDILRRLKLKGRVVKTRSVSVQGEKLSPARVRIEGADWLHLQATKSFRIDLPLKRNRLTAALLQRLPALAVVRDTQIEYVRMPGWAFAALLQMAVTCNPKVVETVLNDYLPLGPAIPPMDLEIGSTILSALDRAEQPSSSESSSR